MWTVIGFLRSEGFGVFDRSPGRFRRVDFRARSGAPPRRGRTATTTTAAGDVRGGRDHVELKGCKNEKPARLGLGGVLVVELQTERYRTSPEVQQQEQLAVMFCIANKIPRPDPMRKFFVPRYGWTHGRS
jgi:hypothetical protein